MKKLTAILASAMLATLTSCTTTGGLSDAATAAFNSPAVQAELAILEQIGGAALNAYIQSHLMTKRLESKESAIQAAIAKAIVECPSLSKTTIETVIRAKFASK